VTAVAIAPDGTWLDTAGRDGTARIWNAATGLLRLVCLGHTDAVSSLAVAPDGTWLVTGSWTPQPGYGTWIPAGNVQSLRDTTARSLQSRSPPTAPGWLPQATTGR
jgi:WD40 repeat protein